MVTPTSGPPEPEEPTPSPPRRNRRTKEFKFLYGELPENIQSLAKKAFEKFLENPNHKSLRRHKLKDNSRGKHEAGSYSVSITMQYRAIYVEHGDVNLWYWIGTHAKYNQFTGDG